MNTKFAIIALTLATAIIHLVLGIQFGNPLFILNAVGYVGLLGLLYLDIQPLAALKPYARWALIGYTALTIVLYFVMNPDPFGSTLGLVDKLVEAVLVVMLFIGRPQN